MSDTEQPQIDQNIEYVSPPEPEIDETEAETESEPTPEDNSEETNEETTENKEDDLNTLPLPDDDSESKKAIPKWVEKKLSRKEMELQEASHRAALYEAELQRLRTNAPQLPAVDAEAPRREAFQNEDDYIAARIEYTLENKAKKQQLEAHQQSIINADATFRSKLKETMDAGSEKYEDFEETVKPLFSSGFPANRAMAEAIVDSPYKHDMFQFLGKNFEKAKEIALLNPVQAVKKIAELEARFNERKKSNGSQKFKPIDSVKTNQPKNDVVNNIADLTKNAANMSQRAFEAAVKKINAAKPSIW